LCIPTVINLKEKKQSKIKKTNCEKLVKTFLKEKKTKNKLN